MKDITSFYKMHPSIMIRLLQKDPEGAKSRPMMYSLRPLKRLMITTPLLKMILPTVEEGTLVETYEIHMSNFKPKDNPSSVFISEILWKKSSGRNSPLMTGSSSLSTTRRFLPRLGHHLQVIPKTLHNTPRVPDGGTS